MDEDVLPRKSVNSDYKYPEIPDEIEVAPEQYLILIADKSISRKTLEGAWKDRVQLKYSNYPNLKYRETMIKEKSCQLGKIVDAYIIPFLSDPTNKRLKTYLLRLGTNDLWQNFLYSMNFLWPSTEIESSPLLLYVNIIQDSCQSDFINKKIDFYQEKINKAIDLYSKKLHQVLIDEVEMLPNKKITALPHVPELEKRVGPYFRKDDEGHYLCLFSLSQCLEGVKISRHIAMTYLRKSDGNTFSNDMIKKILYRLKKSD